MKYSKRYIALFVVITLLFIMTAFSLTATVSTDDIGVAVKEVFENYVLQNGNEATLQGLRTALETEIGFNKKITVWEKNFYIKHAVDGVIDQDDNPNTRIDIKGSDGAVAAIIRVDGKPYGLTTPIKHITENLGKLEIATLGDYDGPDGTRIINWIGNSNPNKKYKVVLPQNTSYVNTNGITFEGGNAENIVAMVMLGHKNMNMNASPRYSKFNNLRAVVMSDSITNFPTTDAFCECKQLKYVHLSEKMISSIPRAMFKNCSKLENVNIPSDLNRVIDIEAFYGTALREIEYPNVTVLRDAFAEPTFSKGTRNQIVKGFDMSYSQMAAYSCAAVSQLNSDKPITDKDIEDAVKSVWTNKSFNTKWIFASDDNMQNGGTLQLTRGESIVYNIDYKVYLYDSTDKPSSYKMAYYSTPMISKFETEASQLREFVLNSTDSVSVTGKRWYISNRGDNTNDGTTPAKAWATTDAISIYKDNIKPGDAVLFERGGVFRGGFTAKTGVYYGAYGSGDKPCIYGSSKAGSGKWIEKKSNIWCFEDESFSMDVGGVIFDHGKAWGNKKGSLAELTKEYDFTLENEKVYIYMNQNPTDIYESIELSKNDHLISIPSDVSNVVFDNLTIKYSGGHGIRTNNGSANVTIKNCEFGWIGGSYLSSDGTRYGNAIEFWQGIDTATITNCWIYQIYDSGVTHQGPDEYTAKNITVSGNLIEYCGFGSFEYWHNQSVFNSMQNIEYSSNILRFSGFGYGAGRDGIGYHIHSNGATNDNKATNFVIKNNIFDLADNVLFDIRGHSGTMPILSGNTYSQYDGYFLGWYGTEITKEPFDLDVDNIIRSIDNDAVIVHNEF